MPPPMMGYAMNPWRVLTVITTVLQGLVVLALVAPVPSNKIRGAIVGSLNHIWKESTTLRSALALFCAVNCIEIYLEARFMYYAPPRPPPGAPRHHRCEFIETQGELFAAERNSYLAAFSLFIYFIMRRLLELQRQLFLARQYQKQGAQEEYSNDPVIAEAIPVTSPTHKKDT